MKAHFVTLLYPGGFFGEESKHPIAEWSVNLVKQRIQDSPPHVPDAFYFTTRERGPDDLDSHETKRSSIYYLGGTVRTKEEILAGTSQAESILRSNMRNNDYIGVVEKKGRSMPLHAGDVVLPALS